MFAVGVICFLIGAASSGYACFKWGRSVEAKAQAVIKAVKS